MCDFKITRSFTQILQMLCSCSETEQSKGEALRTRCIELKSWNEKLVDTLAKPFEEYKITQHSLRVYIPKPGRAFNLCVRAQASLESAPRPCWHSEGYWR